MILASGEIFDLLNPDPALVALPEVAIALSRIPRFLGHTRGAPYSVALHSLLVAGFALTARDTPRTAVLALLHDAHEAYTGDTTRPMQRALGGEAAEALHGVQDRVQLAILDACGISSPDALERRIVKSCDDRALALELSLFWPERYPREEAHTIEAGALAEMSEMLKWPARRVAEMWLYSVTDNLIKCQERPRP